MNVNKMVGGASPPFRNEGEAAIHASALCRAFDILNVRMLDYERGIPIEIGLDETARVIAVALGYAQWKDMISALVPEVDVIYFNEYPNLEEITLAFAVSIAGSLGSAKLLNRIKLALKTSALGCSPDRRKYASIQMHGSSFKRVVKMNRLINLEEGLYVSTFYPTYSKSDNDLLYGDHLKSVAELLIWQKDSR